MSYLIDAACGCCTGRIRGNNEDNFYFCGDILEQENSGLEHPVCRKLPLNQEMCFFVFDGMGGEEAGETAAFMCARTAKQHCESSNSPGTSVSQQLEDLCRKMNERVCREAQTLEHGRMGSTAVGLLFRPDEVYACNIGDSRAFRLRDNELMQLSKDDTDFIPLPGMETPKRKPRLSQHFGISPDELTLEPHIAKGELLAGDQYLICSDGLTDMVTNIEICTIMKEHHNAVSGVEALIDRAMAHGGRDNTTVILCRVEEIDEKERGYQNERDTDMAGLGYRAEHWFRRVWEDLRNQKNGQHR